MKTFLIIQTASIGDVILSTAMAAALHKTLPHAQIDYLVKKGNEGIFEGNPHIRHLYVWDKKHEKYKNMLRLIFQMRREGYDAVYNLQRFMSSGIFTLAAGAKKCYGFKKNPLSMFFTRRYAHSYHDHWHETTRNHQMIAELCGPQAARPQLFSSPQLEAQLSPYKTKGYITITPASLWFTKQYPKEQWIDFIQKLPQHINIYLLGGPADKILCQQIAEAAQHPGLMIMAGRLSISASAVLMRDALMNYVNDSAAQHIASAMNAPTTTLYCSTLPAFGFGPLSDDSLIIESPKTLSCRPCGLHGHKACPQQHFECATTINTQRLIDRYEHAIATRG